MEDKTIIVLIEWLEMCMENDVLMHAKLMCEPEWLNYMKYNCV